MVMLEEGVIDFDQTDVRGGATTSRSEQGRHLLRGPCAQSPEPGPEGEAGETKLAGGHSATGGRQGRQGLGYAACLMPWYRVWAFS